MSLPIRIQTPRWIYKKTMRAHNPAQLYLIHVRLSVYCSLSVLSYRSNKWYTLTLFHIKSFHLAQHMVAVPVKRSQKCNVLCYQLCLCRAWSVIKDERSCLIFAKQWLMEPSHWAVSVSPHWSLFRKGLSLRAAWNQITLQSFLDDVSIKTVWLCSIPLVPLVKKKSNIPLH